MEYDECYTSDMKTTAKRTINNELVHAANVTKNDGPFYCQQTFEELILRKGPIKRAHFAYKSRISPTDSCKESELHKSCKEELLNALIKAYPDGNWQTERIFPKDKQKGYKEVRADLSGRIKKVGVIIEIQVSTLSIKQILHRTKQYSMRGGYILWIIPLKEDLGTEKFRPRFFERYIHSMYYGRVYYWQKGDGTKLTPVHFAPASRYIEMSQWYEEDGTERCEGGYDKTYSVIKIPEYGTTVDLLMGFKAEDRKSFDVENENLSVPECKIYMDRNLPFWRINE